MSSTPTDPKILAAIDDLADLRTAYVFALQKKQIGNNAVEQAADQAHKAAVATVSDAAVVAKVDRGIRRLGTASGLNPEAGLDVLGKIDLRRLREDDLELHLSRLLGYNMDQFRDHVSSARRALKELTKESGASAYRAHDSGVLLELLAYSHDTFHAARLARQDPTGKAGNRSRKAKVASRIFGCVYAVGIIVANSDFGQADFKRSYFIGSGVSHASGGR